MRWFKHLTSSQDDEIMAELIDCYGAEGYGVWWIVLEKIGSQLETGSNEASVRYSMRRWVAACNVDQNTFLPIIQFLVDRGRLFCRQEGDLLTIQCDNLLKYRDEYSKKKASKGDSGETPERLRTNSGETPERLQTRVAQVPGQTASRSETETETETETESNVRPPGRTRTQSKKTDYSDEFEAWWAELWRKEKKPRAWTVWKQIQKAGELPSAQELINAYRKLANCKYQEWTKQGGQFHPHPATLLQNRYWQDVENIRHQGSGGHVGLERKDYDAGEYAATIITELANKGGKNG